MKTSLVKFTVHVQTFLNFLPLVMLLICHAHDLIKSILFSLNFKHLPFFPVAWGLGEYNAVHVGFMSWQHVIKYLQGYCCKGMLGRGRILAQTP